MIHQRCESQKIHRSEPRRTLRKPFYPDVQWRDWFTRNCLVDHSAANKVYHLLAYYLFPECWGWAKPSYKYEEEKKIVRWEEKEVGVQAPRQELGPGARTDWVVGHG
jgi:hypothetical protein